MFTSYASGYGYKYICNELKQKGYKSKRGAEIGTNTIKPILQNERYIGIYSWNKRLVKYVGKYAGNGGNPNVVRIENGQSKTEYMLSGLLRCEKCGGSFTGFYRSNNRGYKHRHYGCSNKINKKGCDCKNINANDLEILVTILFKDEFFNTDLIERTADMIIEKVKSGENNITAKSGDFKKQVSDINAKIKNLLSAMEQGIVNQSVKDRLSDLKKEKALLEQTLSKLTPMDSEPLNRGVLIILILI